MATLEELLEQIRTLPLSLATAEHPSDEDHVQGDVAAAVEELAVAATIANVAQESLKTRVTIARGRGATWTMVGNAIGLTPTRAEWRYQGTVALIVGRDAAGYVAGNEFS